MRLRLALPRGGPMSREEITNANGDILWCWTFMEVDVLHFNIAVLTDSELIAREFRFREDGAKAWDRVQDAEDEDDYVDALGKGVVSIPLADVTRVETGMTTEDLACITVHWDSS